MPHNGPQPRDGQNPGSEKKEHQGAFCDLSEQDQRGLTSRVCDMLNRALKKDPGAIHRLFFTHQRISDKFLGDSGIKFVMGNVVHDDLSQELLLSPLGVINGILRELGLPIIMMVLEEMGSPNIPYHAMVKEFQPVGPEEKLTGIWTEDGGYLPNIEPGGIENRDD